MTTEASKDRHRRVKVYILNAEGQWDDAGTGHVAIVPSEVWPEMSAPFPLVSQWHSFARYLSILMLKQVSSRDFGFQKATGQAFRVVSEEAGEIILESPIFADGRYERQQGVFFSKEWDGS
jgi:hypothetical protein